MMSGIKNDNDNSLTYSLEFKALNCPGECPDADKWFSLVEESATVNSQEFHFNLITVKIPRNAQLGDYLIQAEVKSNSGILFKEEMFMTIHDKE